jgi:hypothetical protein
MIIFFKNWQQFEQKCLFFANFFANFFCKNTFFHHNTCPWSPWIPVKHGGRGEHGREAKNE